MICLLRQTLYLFLDEGVAKYVIYTSHFCVDRAEAEGQTHGYQPYAKLKTLKVMTKLIA